MSGDPEKLAETAQGDTASLYGSELGAGARVGAYEIVEVSARGGFGVVYQAVSGDGRTVAIKVLHPHLSDTPAILRRFQQEAGAARRVDHPNVAQAFELGSFVDGRPFLVMEWVEGQTLEAALRSGAPLDLATTAAVADGLAAALEAVHAAGVVHRDLKCSNVMLSGAGASLRVKLLDFGIAKLLDQDARLTATDARMGTPSYMAPEQILGQRVTAATDLYAFGVLLFQMLTGRLPFPDVSATELDAARLEATAPRASDVATVPEVVADVVARCLARAPAHRFGSAGELRQELARAFADPSAPGKPLRAETVTALGVRVAGDEGADLAPARRALENEGLTIALAREGSFLAVTALPAASEARRSACGRVLRLALSLPAERLTIGLHVAPVATLLVRGTPQFVGGELFDFAWPRSSPGVTASDAALEGLEAELLDLLRAVRAARP